METKRTEVWTPLTLEEIVNKENHTEPVWEYYTQSKLYNTINNKSVVIVGRASYLIKAPEYSNQGEFIDSHDVVVRVNCPYPNPHKMDNLPAESINSLCYIAPSFQEHLGKKTDVVYLSPVFYGIFTKNLLDKFINDGGKILGEGDILPAEPKQSDMLWAKYIPNLEAKTTYHRPQRMVHKQLKSFSYNIHPHEKWNSGCVALAELLFLNNFKSLHIIGFTGCMCPDDQFELTSVSSFPTGHGKTSIAWPEYALKNNKVSTGHVLKELVNDLQSGKMDSIFEKMWKLKEGKWGRPDC